jgi:hypothetical protein
VQKITNAELAAELSAGMTMAAISRKYGMDLRALFRRKARIDRKLAILAPPVPEGFEVSQLSTTVDKDGNTKSQSVRAVPAPLEAEHSELIPAGHTLKGLSTLVDGDGEIRSQWVKTKIDDVKRQIAMEAAAKALAESIPPLWPMDFYAAQPYSKDLLNLYTLTDCHVGMLAWAKEAGEPWDLRIAEEVLVGTFTQMIESAPKAEVGVVNQLGDFLHFDGLDAVTPTSKHMLDADSRFQKMVAVAVRILEQIIIVAARKHPIVRVYMHEGNHDMAGSVWLRVMFARLFQDTPRIIVEDSPNPYVALQHGKTMLAFHHGHLGKKPQLPLIFAAQYSEMWGATKYRYCHTGHLHHVEEKEHPGIRIEQHATLAAKDAYAARGGWHSLRQATSRTYHVDRGEVARATFLPLE